MMVHNGLGEEYHKWEMVDVERFREAVMRVLEGERLACFVCSFPPMRRAQQ